MIKLKKLCNKNTIIKLLSFTFAMSFICADVSADDVIFPQNQFEDVGSLLKPKNQIGRISLLSNEEISASLDFARLNNNLTVEVSGNPTSDYTLFVAKYNDENTLLGTDIINNIQSKNYVDITGSSYERIFLWNLSNQKPLCNSITTKPKYDIIEGTDGEWVVSSDGHTLYNYIGSSSDVVIPNSYNGKRIFMVENTPAIQNGGVSQLSQTYKYNIFNERTDITSLKISDGIQLIGSFVFACCSNITSEFDLPYTLNTIGNYSYYKCNKMTGNIDFSKIKRIYTGSFMECTSLTGDLDLSNLVLFKDYAFYNCKSINGNLTLPSLSVIPESAFYNCNNITGDLIIPEGVTHISNLAFANSTSSKLKSLSLPSTLKVIGTAAFQFQTGFKNELILPNGLTYIGDVAFNHCTGFSNTSLTIPSTVKTIGGDYNVKSNTGYGSHVFYDSFKNMVEYIADGDYFKSQDGVLYSSDMTRLVAYPPAKADESFTVPEGITQIDEMAFGYSKFKKLTLPDSYILSENVPENVVNNMANNIAVALYHYNKIENIYFNDTNQNYTSVDGIVYSKDLKDIWYVPTNKTGVIDIPSGTETIKKGSFYIENNSASAEKYTGVNIPETVSLINSNAITAINLRPLTITISDNNPFYKVANGKITKK